MKPAQWCSAAGLRGNVKKLCSGPNSVIKYNATVAQSISLGLQFLELSHGRAGLHGRKGLSMMLSIMVRLTA